MDPVVYDILIEERVYPTDHPLGIATRRFEPERIGSGRFARVEPFEIDLQLVIAELTGAFPGPGADIDPRYSFLFAIWSGSWTRESSLSIDLDEEPFANHIVAYYADRRSPISEDEVHVHAVSLRGLEVIGTSPVESFPTGIVLTADGPTRAVARPFVRTESHREVFQDWSTWTQPDPTNLAQLEASRLPGARGLRRPERRVELAQHTTGRATAFYEPFEAGVWREPDPEAPASAAPDFGILLRLLRRLPTPARTDDSLILQALDQGEPAAIRRVLKILDGRQERLRAFQRLLRARLNQQD